MNERRKSEDDVAFIAKLGIMELSLLHVALKNHSTKSAPRWKRVAIRRAISRLDPRPYEWVLGLWELNVRTMDPLKCQLYQETVDRLARVR